MVGNTVKANLVDVPEAPRIPVDDWKCMKNRNTKEIYGPTDINAQIANRRLAVAINDEGTVTVMRYPRPSYFDQINYETEDRQKEDFGVNPNEGAFIGIYIEGKDKNDFLWLKELKPNQTYIHEWSDTLKTEYRIDDWGLDITITDAIPHDLDTLIRHIEVKPDLNSNAEKVKLIGYENYNLVVSKRPASPTQDWCKERQNVDKAIYDSNSDIVYHTRQGISTPPGLTQHVVMGITFASGNDGHQIGVDDYELLARPLANILPSNVDAFVDAKDGSLSGNDYMFGQTTGAVSKELNISEGDREATLIMAGGDSKEDLIKKSKEASKRNPQDVWERKLDWFKSDLSDAPMPDTDDEDIIKLSKRALVTLYSLYDEKTGAIVASIATQSPYGQDWVRDGAFFNIALHLMGKEEWVEKRNKWYQELQAKWGLPRKEELAGTPPGNWVMNYYADGMAGGPIAYEIDATSYGLWTLWYHYKITGNKEYLSDIYPAIQRTADFLTWYKDPSTGLQAPAPEDDHPKFKQTILGASTVHLGLESAVKAAEALGRDSDAKRYNNRLQELRSAITEHLWNEDTQTYGIKRHAFPEMIWPTCFKDYEAPRMKKHMDAMWEVIEKTFQEPQAKERKEGLYESKMLIPLAKAWKDDSDKLSKVRDGIKWVAKRHATPDTHIMGEVWRREEGEIISIVSQPHCWEQILFYMAALEAYPPLDEPLEDMADCKGVVGRLLENQ